MVCLLIINHKRHDELSVSANETWKVLRKATTQALNNENMQKNQNYMQAESAQLMFDLAHTPEVCIRLSYRHTALFTSCVNVELVQAHEPLYHVLHARHHLRLSRGAHGFATPYRIPPRARTIHQRARAWTHAARRFVPYHDDRPAALGKMEAHNQRHPRGT